MPQATVIAVASDSGHNFTKPIRGSITLLKGLGVKGDAHMGVTVKHRSRVAKEPTAPNLRQIHLIHAELFDELEGKGFTVKPGDVGENITTRGVDLLGLPTGTRLGIGPDAVVEVTGLRNPCKQLNGIQDGLLKAVLDKDADGNLIRKSGIMGIVIEGGDVEPGNKIDIEFPNGEYRPLKCV